MSDQEYIFCPLCGEHKWLTDKSRNDETGQLISHRCSACQKFSYIDVRVLVQHPVLIGIAQTIRRSVVVEISHYKIFVFYDRNETWFEDTNLREIILTVKSAIQFNWYNQEKLIEKLKTYIIFS